MLSNRDLPNLIEGDFVAGAGIVRGGARAFIGWYRLPVFWRTADFQLGCDTTRPEGVAPISTLTPSPATRPASTVTAWFSGRAPCRTPAPTRSPRAHPPAPAPPRRAAPSLVPAPPRSRSPAYTQS